MSIPAPRAHMSTAQVLVPLGPHFFGQESMKLRRLIQDSAAAGLECSVSPPLGDAEVGDLNPER